ncbi:hypothetical protein SCLCIDRAFT_575132 [Scleroderma citrinum Foug A]|uniref:Uncharacterized protein n=1 Tax=Scleroderma citrinum Foug A TaxID=1036808 RepID=A0A0C3CUE6_9AGAM|nr:hypothetical protein SCLCIDRAFT_575132 [Scleroderma citrinum Foug A]
MPTINATMSTPTISTPAGSTNAEYPIPKLTTSPQCPCRQSPPHQHDDDDNPQPTSIGTQGRDDYARSLLLVTQLMRFTSTLNSCQRKRKDKQLSTTKPARALRGLALPVLHK